MVAPTRRPPPTKGRELHAPARLPALIPSPQPSQVDVDECKDLSQQYGVKSMPTFKFLKAGKELDEMKGADDCMRIKGDRGWLGGLDEVKGADDRMLMSPTSPTNGARRDEACGRGRPPRGDPDSVLMMDCLIAC